LIKSHKAPRHVVVPQKIKQETVFLLDVDHQIWNNQGLGDDDSEVPQWLGDDRVRKDIQAMLTMKRCEEEEFYLKREAAFLQAWFKQEWEYLENAINQCSLCFYISSLFFL
jgi:hypothetical protein